MTQPFIRDRFTWLAYFMLGYYAFILSVIGPAVPFIRNELKINYGDSALYISAFAAGMFTAGLTSTWVTRRFGRSRLFWGGAALMAVGVIALTFAHSLPFGVVSSFFASLLGSYLLVTIQSSLSDRHGDNRAFALTEANVFAVLAASAAPILVGFGESQGWTWRVAIYAGVVVGGVVIFWAWRKIRLPQPEQHASQTNAVSSNKRGRLPLLFWVYWVVVFFSVAVEWCVLFWASTYMETVVGLSKEAAASSVALFTIAQFVGRAAGSWLTRRYASANLLLIASAIVLIGFPMFWLGRTPIINGFGLFVCGLGVANLFPLTLSLTSAVGVANPDAASGYTSMASGLAILITPQLLGIAADRIGIQSAYAIVLPLALAITLVTFYANRLKSRRTEVATT
ncbi:MAG: MFS transporter [Chloroflexi bacterium]|nr:MFS transporter [Chloroflexota bacterium]MCC6896636.1 MFS transporter [Anaerolineae bacterium]